MSVAARSSGSRDFAARVRRQRLRRVLTGLIVLAGAVLVGLAAWLVGWSDALAVRDVSVEGVSEDRRADVIETAQVPVGSPLARVDTGAIEDRVAALPEAAAVDVGRSWPNTLTIEVTPREPLAAVRSGEVWYAVDESGVLFGESSRRPEGVPVLEAPTDDDEALVRAAGVAMVTGLPSAVRDRVESVRADSEADIRLTLASGATVEMGTAERIDRKAEVLLALIEKQEETPSVYDVSAPEHPAVTP
ncbi:cell division protein FtsQ [Haloactinopolyspora alba]|uniref:Cell division protein FtsQ n=1 Tax=Haloactinopolyspora alba TaxID=648780 RepID=A0A2P8E439_9ACTN|nr:FtsQ-type POTRA domain-containing protein [Haloactinopolyspora alba]PSL04220.1 cell division protein FtsQ [Haloactinopolyspora alba]